MGVPQLPNRTVDGHGGQPGNPGLSVSVASTRTPLPCFEAWCFRRRVYRGVNPQSGFIADVCASAGARAQGYHELLGRSRFCLAPRGRGLSFFILEWVVGFAQHALHFSSAKASCWYPSK